MASELVKRQWEFSRLLPLLLQKANALGFEVSLGEAWRIGDTRCHGARLAVDLNLWIDGALVKDMEPHRPLGEFWEGIGGSWGGRFKSGDANHYSLAYNGKR